MRRPGFLSHLEMPSWLRGSSFEEPARRIGRLVKKSSLSVERILRGGKVPLKLPSIDESIWLDFDFAALNSLPESDPLLASFLAHLEPNHVVYDVGSFVGCYAVAAARRLREGQVIAFEPVPASAGLLRRHCLLNGVGDRVRVVEAACSNAAGVSAMPAWPTLTTTWASGNALRNVYPRKEAQPTWLPVCTLKLDEFVQAGGAVPGVVKIDVEGAELWVLQGAQTILETARPLVFLEIHAFAWSLFDTTENRLREFLSRIRYDVCELQSPYVPLKSFPDYGHALLRPRAKGDTGTSRSGGEPSEVLR